MKRINLERITVKHNTVFDSGGSRKKKTTYTKTGNKVRGFITEV